MNWERWYKGQFVCPAHAGVYRVPTPGLRPFRCLAPHTRGSTLLSTPGQRSHIVCPAHAGVYPRHHPCMALLSRLPRTRGGLPTSQALTTLPGMFAPHTRGSTVSAGGAASVRDVCPAHAGVYPGMFAPHTRGSTRMMTGRVEVAIVCPAHAGVYRCRWSRR